MTNALKRNFPTSIEGAMPLDFADFQKLQVLAEHAVGVGHDLSAEEHEKIQHLDVNGKIVGEGDMVELAGYVYEHVIPGLPESVNCCLSGAENNDIHIILTPRFHDPDVKVITETIPLHRKDGWANETINRFGSKSQMMRIAGPLFYDGEHETDGSDACDPSRHILWEIHPVAEIWVCMRPDGVCETAGEGWELLSPGPIPE
jgi:hypothetical protein